jgi:hypothetical protein
MDFAFRKLFWRSFDRISNKKCKEIEEHCVTDSSTLSRQITVDRRNISRGQKSKVMATSLEVHGDRTQSLAKARGSLTPLAMVDNP